MSVYLSQCFKVLSNCKNRRLYQKYQRNGQC